MKPRIKSELTKIVLGALFLAAVLGACFLACWLSGWIVIGFGLALYGLFFSWVMGSVILEEVEKRKKGKSIDHPK